MDHVISLDIGGEIFKVKKVTLERIQGTLLNDLDSEIKCYNFERDPHLFRHIINAYRYGLVHVPRDICPLLFKKELLFWNIPLTLVAPCCWKYLYEVDNDIETVKVLIQNDTGFENNEEIKNAKNSIKSTVHASEHPCEEAPVKIESNINKEKDDDDVNKLNLFWLFLDEPASSVAAKVGNVNKQNKYNFNFVSKAVP